MFLGANSKKPQDDEIIPVDPPVDPRSEDRPDDDTIVIEDLPIDDAAIPEEYLVDPIRQPYLEDFTPVRIILNDPLVDEKTVPEDPSTDEPVTDEPYTEEPITEAPATEETIPEEWIFMEAPEEPVSREPKTTVDEEPVIYVRPYRPYPKYNYRGMEETGNEDDIMRPKYAYRHVNRAKAPITKKPCVKPATKSPKKTSKKKPKKSSTTCRPRNKSFQK